MGVLFVGLILKVDMDFIGTLQNNRFWWVKVRVSGCSRFGLRAEW